jgi:carboxyl-terminal processing protease
MTKKLWCILLAWLITAQSAAFESQSSGPGLLLPLPEQTQSALWSAQILSRYHYRAAPLDDAMSEKIFANYLEALDRERVFFLQSDIDRLASARAQLDDAILKQDLSIPFAIFNLQRQRLVERVSHARELVKQKPVFTLKESYPTPVKKHPGRRAKTSSASCGASASKTTGCD